MLLSLHADVKVVEHFDYPVGYSMLAGNTMDGGAGFAAKWTSPSTLASNVDFDIVTADLAYDNLKTKGHSLRHFRTDPGNWPKEVYRKFSFEPIDIAGSTNMYIAFVFNIDNIGNNQFTFRYTGKDAADGDVNLDFVIPSTGGGTQILLEGTGKYSLNDIYISGIQSGNNLLLMKASEDNSGSNPDTNKYNKVDFWLNPDFKTLGTPDKSEYYCVSMFHGDGVNLMPDQMLFEVTLKNDSSYLFDEFYISDSLDDIRNAFGSICIFK